MKNITKKLSYLLTTLTLLLVGVSNAWATGTETTVYYAVPSATVGTYTVKCNTNHKGDGDDWHLYDMRLTDSTYNGNLLYVCTFTDTYGGLGKLQFQLHDMTLSPGETWKSQQQPIGSWTDVGDYNGKIYIHNVAGWKDFGRDITIYAVPEIMNSATWDEASHTLYANFKYGDGESEWVRRKMYKTAYTYQGEPIYSDTLFIQYNVIKKVQFLYNDGSDHELYAYDPDPQYVTDNIDSKIFIGSVDETPTWISYARDYNVELHNNGGRVWADSVGNYTSGIGATLPTNVSKWGCDFDGWYENSSLTGDPVTTIGTSETGDKDYYAKWTSIQQTYPIASHPEFLAAQAGDILVVNITGIHTGAHVYLYTIDDGYPLIADRSLSATGKHAFQLTSAQATALRTYGLLVTGNNFTFSDVDILYRKTIWTGTLSDNSGWAEEAVDKSIFSGLAGGDFIGFNISAINDGNSYHTYAIRADYVQQISGSSTEIEVGIKELSSANITAISGATRVDIDAQYLDISNLYSYTSTRTYTVTLNTNDGTINTGNVTAYTFAVGATLPTDVTRTGYSFGGWYPDEEFAEERVYSITTTDYGDKTYYAKWTANVYTVEEHNNGGRIKGDSVASYTYGEGATLPTYVTKWGYWFDGWYDNAELTGEPVTTISTSETGNKEYYAKWTSIGETLAIGDHPEFLAAQEGDIIVVTVSDVQQGAQIRLNEEDNKRIDNKSISAIGKYAFQLSAGAADSIHTNGLKLSGLGYTKSSVTILYRKTLKAINLGVADSCKWGSTELAPASDKTIFEGLTTDHYLGFEVTALCGEASDYHDYQVQCNYKNFMVSGKLTATGIHLQELEEEMDKAPLDSLQGPKRISVGSGTLSLGNLYAYTNTRTYSITFNTDEGTIYGGTPTAYTFGAGISLPTDVLKWANNFEGWYDNAELAGDPVTAISTTDYGDKTYYAKWSSIAENLPVASHPEFLAAQEGDIIVVTVTDVQSRPQISLKDWYYHTIELRSIDAAGRYAFQLTANMADSIRMGGLRISGRNYTRSSVAIRYRKTLWTGTLVSPVEKVVWQSQSIASSKFADIEDGDYVSFTIPSIVEDSSWCQYNLYSATGGVLTYSAKSSGAGTYIHEIPSGKASELKAEGDYIAAQNLTISAFSRYLTTRDYTVTLNTNGGTINSGNVTSYTYQTGATLPTNVTRTNYTFMGWYDNSSFTGEPVTEITTTDLGNKEYWAKWTFIIYRTGDAPDGGIETFDGGTIDSPIEYRMKVHTLDQWYSLYLPFDVDAIKVIEDGVYYSIQPYYRPEVGGTLYQGHYFIRTPAKTTDFEIANFSDWRDPSSYVFTPAGKTPYVIRWHDSYFLNKYISFFGHTDAAIPETMTVGDRPTKDSVVNVYGNDAMVNGSVVDGYTLVADYGHGAWLREETIGNSRTVLPFECYLRANDKTTPIFKALRRTDTTTGIDQITNDKSPMTNKKLINGQLIIIRDNKMYNVMGMEVAQ